MSATGADLVRFRALLAERLGWAFADNDLPQLAQVLARRAEVTGTGIRAYLADLAGGGSNAETTALAEALSVTETYFFRHAEQLAALAEVVLPERLAARAGRRVLKMLSVGCSSGEEAYTLAILARRAQPDPSWIVSVIGLDANPAVLHRAVTARYSPWSLRETPEVVRQRWFRADQGQYEPVPEVRAAVQFRRHNVADDDPVLWQDGQYDVIFCRNLLMYLAPDVAARLVRRMTTALTPGGYLFLGHTDSLGSRPEGLVPQHTHGTFYYRRPADPPPGGAAREAAGSPPRQPPGARSADDRYGRALTLLAEERFGPALAVVEAPAGAAPSRELTLLHGVLLAQAGRLDEAQAVARRLLDAGGLYADAHHLHGFCLEAGSSADGAIGQYQLAAYLDPAFAMPRLRLGLLARRRGDHRTAVAELDRALDLLRDESDERIVLFGGGFGRIALTALCRAERDACEVRR